MDRPQTKLLFLLLLVLAAGALSLSLGTVGFNITRWHQALTDSSSLAAQVLWQIRMPRMIGGAAAGCGLALAGYLVQSLLANDLASPSLLGISSGAGFGAALFSAFVPFALGGMSFAAFFGAMAACLIISALAFKIRAGQITIVLAGLAISQLFTAGTDLILTFVPDALNGYTDFRIGGLANLSYARILPGLLLIAAGTIAVFLSALELELMTLGHENADSLGLPVRFWNFFFLICASLLSAGAISYCGLLSFVGLITPHMVRRLLPGSCQVQLAGCALGGALLVMCADLLARTLFIPFELPAGIFLSLLGAPFFLYLLLKSRRRRS